MMKQTTPFLCVLSMYFGAPRPAARFVLGSVTKMLHEVLHGVLSDDAGGAGSVFFSAGLAIALT